MQNRPDTPDVPGGNVALGLTIVAWVVVLAMYLSHRVVLSSDSLNNHVHVWAIARDLWHHGRLPWRLPSLGHGEAYAYPYGFTNWTTAAIVWPLLGDRGVTLWTAVGAVGCVVATFVAFPELRRGWWAAAVVANPAIVEALLFGQQSFAWAAALLLLGIAAWRRGRRPAAALLVGLAQATHAPIVLPIGALLVAFWLVFERDRRALLRWYALSLLISLPAVALVFASPGYADSTMRDRLVNFIGTLGPRVLVVAIPIILVGAQHLGKRVLAPLAFVVVLATNAALQEPLGVTFQWRALTRTPSTASLDTFVSSPKFVPGATYRVLRGGNDAKLGMYHVLRAGGRLDSEMFPESMAIRRFTDLVDYEKLLCDRHVDFVIAYAAYDASHGTNELQVLAGLAAARRPHVALQVIARGPGHAVYAVDRRGCGAVPGSP